MVEDCHLWFFTRLRACALSSVWNLQSVTAHEQTAYQLKDELQTLMKKPDMVFATDPKVNDQFSLLIIMLWLLSL